MGRIVAIAIVLMLTAAVSASPQDRPDPAKASTGTAVNPKVNTSGVHSSQISGQAQIFSKSSIDKVVARSIAAAPPPVPRLKKGFWRGPYPWVIGAIAIVVLVVAFGGGGF